MKGKIFMMEQRKTEIFIQTRERIFVRGGSQTEQLFCKFCDAETVLIAPERAAVALNLTTREIYRRIESGKVHFIETSNGLVFICLSSLDAKSDFKSTIIF